MVDGPKNCGRATMNSEEKNVVDKAVENFGEHSRDVFEEHFYYADKVLKDNNKLSFESFYLKRLFKLITDFYINQKFVHVFGAGTKWSLVDIMGKKRALYYDMNPYICELTSKVLDVDYINKDPQFDPLITFLKGDVVVVPSAENFCDFKDWSEQFNGSYTVLVSHNKEGRPGNINCSYDIDEHVDKCGLSILIGKETLEWGGYKRFFAYGVV